MINLRQDFRLEFDVYLGTRDGGGADGIAFGLQPINTSIGNSGGGLGMQGVSPSVGVYLDTYRNGFKWKLNTYKFKQCSRPQ